MLLYEFKDVGRRVCDWLKFQKVKKSSLNLLRCFVDLFIYIFLG